MAIVVSDTSPLLALRHLALVSLLEALFDRVYLPPAVVAELQRPSKRFAPVDVGRLTFIEVRSPTNRTVVDDLKRSLDPGEAEAIALAIELTTDVLIDESAGRAEATRRGLVPIGVAGILVNAKQRGLVTHVLPLLDRLQAEIGFFVSTALRSDIAHRTGE